jgi:hypothetical protein
MRRLTVARDYVFEYNPDGTGNALIIIKGAHLTDAAVLCRYGDDVQWEITIPMVVLDAFRRQRVYEAMEEFLGPGGHQGVDASRLEQTMQTRNDMRVEDE